MMQKAEKRLLMGALSWIGVVLTVGALALVYFVNPLERHLAFCFFHLTTGLYCPGCGTTRMLHLFTHGHVGAAFMMNPLMFITLPLLGYVALSEVAPYLFGGRVRLPRPTFKPWMGIVYAAITLTFSIVRNIPGSPLMPL